jgi:DNA-binding response OmpR family regulator
MADSGAAGSDPAVVAPSPMEAGREMRTRRILVVDDDQLARAMIRDTLEHAGFQVRTASDGTEAFYTLPGFEPDVVVMDVIMPGENGYRVCRSIKELGSHGSVPAPKVLLLTSRRVDDEVERENVLLNFSQADGMMYKPFEPTRLVERITLLLAG